MTYKPPTAETPKFKSLVRQQKQPERDADFISSERRRLFGFIERLDNLIKIKKRNGTLTR